jgi:cyclic pyranopterin phosphate synthase
LNFKIDSHKLIYHIEALNNWRTGKYVYPVTMEISPSGACNHRCVFCGLDYLGYKPKYLDINVICNNLKGLVKKNLKAVVVAGEGEPLLNRNTPEIINRLKSYNIDIALSTNGVLFSGDIAVNIMKSLSWVRFSVNAGTEKTHMLIHKGKENDFKTILNNLDAAVKIKKNNNFKTTLGVQMLLLPENKNEVLVLGRKLKEIGVDYFTVKPFSKHPKSISDIIPDFDYADYYHLEKQLKEIETDSFKVFFRKESMDKRKSYKPYKCCYGLPFWGYIDASGEVWACIAYIGDKDFSFGNINETSLKELWESRKAIEIFSKGITMDISKCRELCRLDSINTYLYRIKNPEEHDNFI